VSAWWMALAIVALALAVGICIAWRPVRARLRAKELARLRRNFHRQREYLEARFLTIAADSGKPRGLEWVRCDFEDDVIYARNRQSGELTAFVGVTIGFEAVEGGGMEDVAAVGSGARKLGDRRSRAVQSEPGRSGGLLSREPGARRPGTRSSPVVAPFRA